MKYYNYIAKPLKMLQHRHYLCHWVVYLLMTLSVQTGPVLGNIPILFQMQGETTYTPDAGGASQTGYKLRIGYALKQWLAVQIVTNNNKNDVLVVQIDEFYSSGSNSLHTGHKITYEDYYRTSDDLNIDQNRAYHISAFNYVEAKDYYIDLVRYVGSNSGEDWNAAANKYSLMQVCFYTSNILFKASTWRNGLKQCYSFEIDQYHSEFKGVELKTLYLNGYKTSVHGWIDGPYVTSNLYFYHNVPLFTYSQKPAVVLEMGTVSNRESQDFYAYSPQWTENGDYHGSQVTDMVFDNSVSGGYQHGEFITKYWNADPAQQIAEYSFTTLRIFYSRNISTYDPYDKQLKSTSIFCLYLFAGGSISSDLTDKKCDIVELSYQYPRVSLQDNSHGLNLPQCILIAVIAALLFV